MSPDRKESCLAELMNCLFRYNAPQVPAQQLGSVQPLDSVHPPAAVEPPIAVQPPIVVQPPIKVQQIFNTQPSSSDSVGLNPLQFQKLSSSATSNSSNNITGIVELTSLFSIGYKVISYSS